MANKNRSCLLPPTIYVRRGNSISVRFQAKVLCSQLGKRREVSPPGNCDHFCGCGSRLSSFFASIESAAFSVRIIYVFRSNARMVCAPGVWNQDESLEAGNSFEAILRSGVCFTAAPKERQILAQGFNPGYNILRMRPESGATRGVACVARKVARTPGAPTGQGLIHIIPRVKTLG